MEIEKILELDTILGPLVGRDAIYLNKIVFNTESDLTLIIEIGALDDYKRVSFNFKGLVYFSSIELDFDTRTQMVSFGLVEDSKLLKTFSQIDHSSKINSMHKHYYIRTYDTVFDVISDKFNLQLV